VILNLILFAYILYRNRNKTLPSPYRLPAFSRPQRQGGRKIIRIMIPVLIFASAVALMFVEILSGRFYPSTTFMLSGVLILAGLIFSIAFFFSGRRNVILTADSGFLYHSLKNMVLNRTRTITAIVLLALGTFTILVTGLNRKTGGDADSQRESGTGGFQLWMSSTIPLTGDLNTAEGKKRSGLEDENLPAAIRFVALPGVAGDDASCLNLNQVAVPGLLGVPSALFGQRRSFTFVNLVAGIDPEHPWKALETIDSPDCINGYADQTVITWGLRKKVGDTLRYTDEQGRILNIRLVGGIANSVFQGKILVSDTLLRSFFPSTTKVINTLIDLPKEDTEVVVQALESRLRDQGVVVTTTSAMLATFGAVENTYLDVFIMLGGFGLLIGTAGLAAMILRSLRDRKKELRLYWSLGFPKKLTYRMLAAEFLLILLSGTFIGVIAALVGTMPSWIRTGIPALPLIIIGAVMIHGMLWIHLMVKKTLRLSENS
jgi:hypothetical protein